MHATMTNDATGQVKEIKVGYSWTFFFFGFWVPLLRASWLVAIITLLVDGLGWLVTFGLGSFLFQIIFAIFLNRMYVSSLLSEGYLPSGEQDKRVMVGKGYLSQSTKVSTLANE